MPEVVFTLRWPDGTEERCWSPSTVIGDYLSEGSAWPVEDFLTLARKALRHASDRVQAVHGYPCSQAAAQLARLELRARDFSDRQAAVTCLSLAPQRR